jgi:hypothetical protein
LKEEVEITTSKEVSGGKRELLNLQSSINYGDANYPSSRRKAGRRICQGSNMGSDLSYLGSDSAVGPQLSIEMGSPEGRILPSSSLDVPTFKHLIQDKSKGKKPLSHLELSMACSLYFGEKGDRSMAFLSALDEEHRRWDMIEDCEL